MKIIKFQVLEFFALIAVAIPLASAQSCAQIVEFGTCSTKAADQMAECSSQVVSVPTFTYWNCVCNGQNALLNCYSLCPDDPNMQLQYQSQIAYKQSTCQYVSDQEQAGLAAPVVASTSVLAVAGATGTAAVKLPTVQKSGTPSSNSPAATYAPAGNVNGTKSSSNSSTSSPNVGSVVYSDDATKYAPLALVPALFWAAFLL